MKKLSIITICYNEPNLEKTCESIMNQSWQDFEWIVIDGGSNDETLAIFDKYNSRIDKFVSEPDNGIYDACNKGINLATGKYLNFMNAGDSFFDSNVLEKFIKQNTSADILYGNTMMIFRDKPNRVLTYPKIIDIAFFVNNNICTQSVFIKSDLFKTYGLFDIHYKIASDYDRWLKFLSESRSFCHLSFIVSNYDMNGISSAQYTQELLQKENREILLKYFSQEEIDKVLETRKIEYKPIEYLFSIKNNWTKSHKIITIFGIQFKINRKH